MRAAALLLLILSSRASFAADPLDTAVRIPRISAGPLVVGEDHPLFELADFPVIVRSSAPVPVRAAWVEGSVRWVRLADELPVPLGRLRVSVGAPPERASLRHRGSATLLQPAADGAATELFVPLMEPGEISVELDGKPAAVIGVSARPASATPLERRHAIDHSCSPWSVRLSGLDDSFVTMNCRLRPIGRVGGERQFVEARWLATNLDGGAVFAANLQAGGPVRLDARAKDGAPRSLRLDAVVPERWNRLRLAAGAGPHQLSSSAEQGNGATGSVMLYANFKLRPEDDLSIRAFEAVVARDPANGAVFNNLGIYLAYNLARILDRRLAVVALLGTQTVSFSPKGFKHRTYTEGVFPQGFEVTYLDAFGRRNRILSGGLFLQPVNKRPYQNYWIRYGGRYFGELNYIYWRSGSRFARMYGVSAVMPFARFF